MSASARITLRRFAMSDTTQPRDVALAAREVLEDLSDAQERIAQMESVLEGLAQGFAGLNEWEAGR